MTRVLSTWHNHSNILLMQGLERDKVDTKIPAGGAVNWVGGKVFQASGLRSLTSSPESILGFWWIRNGLWGSGLIISALSP